MAWFEPNPIAWFTKQVSSWWAFAGVNWWRKPLGSTWDDSIALWDDAVVNWDEGPTGDWYSENPQSWYTKN